MDLNPTTVNDYYCSQKFWWFSVNLERRCVASCCAAAPEKIDLDWLDANPGELFNSPNLLNERQMMLDNNKISSCESTCWSAEERGILSRRNIMQSHVKSHVQIRSNPEMLTLILGTDCNLTCSYCCKQYSTAWYRDVRDNGTYLPDDTRFLINVNDQIREAAGQKNIKSAARYKQILEEIAGFSGLKQIDISGGEPFLYNGLIEIVSKLSAPIEIFTGLGVDPKRFSAILDQLPDNVSLVVSGENIGELYEFNRYGNSYQNFQTNLDSIRRRDINHRFSIVLSNLTIHGYKEFENLYGDEKNSVAFCIDPDYMAINILDPVSKSVLQGVDYKYHDYKIKSALSAECTDEERKKFFVYVKEFARRRNLTLDAFPKHFRDWIDDAN